MNDYMRKVRKRNQSLLIVEGNHEKNKLYWLLFHCFPEINIRMDDIWIYGTNIYMLYKDIEKQYGSEWGDSYEDIDLPFVISKKQNLELLRYKEDFTNIILVFDYERHDDNFSEEKILKMQKYFSDATDMGKLYINYPMIESYQHLKMLPDNQYINRTIPVSLQPGKEYKALVREETVIAKVIEVPHKIENLLDERFGVCEEHMRKKCCKSILDICDAADMDNKIQGILYGVVEDANLQTAKYQIKDIIIKLGYVHNGQTYWNYMRSIFIQIIYHNICKANKIQNNQDEIEETEIKQCFEELDLTEILRVQNMTSQDAYTGYIWVLNTCVFFVPEYNFALVAVI
ncbi:MAG: hypothetical protein HDR03_01980 [Lachnospiraceae bacterium]|nr:hypothetical protein [Lachnospiraceae bacterium]